MDVFSRTQKARRTYRCGWCWDAIPAGDEYVYAVTFWKPEVATGRYHPECWAAAGSWVNETWESELPSERMERGGIRLAEEIEAEEATPDE